MALSPRANGKAVASPRQSTRVSSAFAKAMPRFGSTVQNGTSASARHHQRLASAKSTASSLLNQHNKTYGSMSQDPVDKDGD